jgi:hypothetical protein
LLRIIAVSHSSEGNREAAEGGNPDCDTAEHFAVTRREWSWQASVFLGY